MKYILPSLIAVASSQAVSAATVWYEGDVLGLRTNATVGFVFDGAPASNVDVDMDGTIDDGVTNFYQAIDVDVQGSASVDLSGDVFDWTFRFQFYDADGVFGFTENFDDSVRVNATPIVSNTDLSSRGAAGPTFQNTTWNARSYTNYDFSGTAGGGWFDVTVELDENTGGAQSAGGIGFGFFNGNSTTETDFGGIGYAPVGRGSGAEAAFDLDQSTGASFGVATIPEPSTSILGLLGVLGLAYRKRK